MRLPIICDGRNLFDRDRGGEARVHLHRGRPVRALVAGGAGFIGSHLCDYLLGRGSRSSASTTSSPARSSNIAPPAQATRGFRFIAPTSRLRVHVVSAALDVVFNLASPGLAQGLPGAAARDARGRLTGTRNLLDWRSPKSAVFVLASTSRGLRRPAGPPAAGDLLGQRQPGRPARRSTTRPSASPRRCHGLPPRHGLDHAHRPHLQHLRPADEARRRPGGADFVDQALDRQAADRVRRPHARPAASATSPTWSRGCIVSPPAQTRCR